MCGFWLVIQIVYSSVPGLYLADAPRAPPSALGMSRWLTIRCWTTTSARANAASVSPSPTVQSKTTLFGHVLVELRRARLGRLLGVDDGRQRLVVDVDQRRSRRAPASRRLGDDHRHGVAA